jgi:tetratricopeptide (TPR) repeat protein
MLGLTEFELGNDDLALKHIDKGETLGLDPDVELRRVLLYDQGVLLQRKEKFHAAREILEQLCLQGVQGKNISNALGLTLLRQASKTAPEAGSPDADVVGRIREAECMAGEKKFDEAHKEFDAAVAQYPTSVALAELAVLRCDATMYHK